MLDALPHAAASCDVTRVCQISAHSNGELETSAVPWSDQAHVCLQVPDWSWAPQPAKALGAFSLFAASPASPGQQWRGAAKGQDQEELKSYQLFGAQETHPLAPLLGTF